MEECVNRAQGADTLFPVCISCVFNVKLRARACFLCVMGTRPKHPDTKTTHPADSCIYNEAPETVCVCLCVFQLSPSHISTVICSYVSTCFFKLFFVANIR